MKKRIILALCSLVIAVGGIGMSSIPHKELPVSEELLAEAMEEEPEEIIEEVAEEKVCELGCGLPTGHEGDCVVSEVKEIEVVLKSISMERDLKVKFVDKSTGKVISGADFKMKVTSPSKTTKEYSDHDNDGIIWVKDIDGGKYTVAMMDLEGYVTAKTLSADVKKKIEYKVVEIEDEVKKENQVDVSKEDAEFGGADKDESTSNSVELKDTVEFVESSVEKVGGVQKKDSFGQLVYEKYLYENGQQVYAEQKKDSLGQPMYAVILRESAEFHKDESPADGICDRCKASLRPACTHEDKNDDDVCDKEGCGASVPDLHQHTDTSTAESNGICTECDKLINQEMHATCTDNGNSVCKYCNKSIETPHTHTEPDALGNCTDESCKAHLQCVDSDDEDTLCDTCGEETVAPTEDKSSETGETASLWPFNMLGLRAYGIALRPFGYLGTENPQPIAETGSFIVYDTNSTKIYDPNSAPKYDTSSTPVYSEEPKTVYKGWQTIDGATYYFDKDGKKVTGQQVIQGISYTFSSDGVRSGTIGIDVSKYQTGINWTKVKNAGINFVMIRCGYRGYGSGVLVEDPMYRSHISGAKAAGLRVGVYFFSQAINEAEAVEEASMAVSLAKKYGINMPIAIDSEYANGGRGRADGLSKSARTAVTKAFCNTVKSAGYTPMVYASKSWFSSHLDVSQLSGYRIWVAHYAEKCGYKGTYHIWQNTDKGKVDGVPGKVDMNISSI